MIRDEIAEIVAAYDALIKRALKIVAPGYGFYAPVEHYDLPRLSIDGEVARLTWREAESDGYDGWLTGTMTAEFPANLLRLNDREFDAKLDAAKAEQKERELKALAAREAAAIAEREASDMLEYVRLRAKFGN